MSPNPARSLEIPLAQVDAGTLALERSGLRFSTAGTELDYRRWRTALVIPGTRLAVVVTLIMWVTGTATGWFAAPETILKAVPLMLAGVAPVCFATLLATLIPRVHGWVPTLTTLMSISISLTASWIFYAIFGVPAGASISVIMVTFFAFTIFRLSPLQAAFGPAMAIVPVLGALIVDYRADRLSVIEFWTYTFTPVITLSTGWLIGVTLERATREAFRNERLIARQQQALVEERSQLSRFLAPEVAQMIHERGIEATLIQQTLDLTAVCCDLRGFTAYTQKHGAQQMGIVLREYYEIIVNTAKRYGGTVKDFAGDGALILIGAPVARSDHAGAGLAFARDLLANVRALTTRFTRQETPLGAGVGIATGPCAVGAIGSQSRLEYTAVGSAVNLAARLCAGAADGELRICPDTARAVERNDAWRSELLQFKGFAEPVDVIVETSAATNPI